MRELRPVRRCLRGLADSVKDEDSAAAGAVIGVDGRELFDVARDVDRRLGAIVLDVRNF
jgi:hypothetical protein